MNNRSHVTVDKGMLYVGSQHLSLSTITQIKISPLYDVAPADDLWTLEDKYGNKLSFFNRETGAVAALELLAAALPGLHPKEALKKAQSESLFEQPVTIWTNQTV